MALSGKILGSAIIRENKICILREMKPAI